MGKLEHPEVAFVTGPKAISPVAFLLVSLAILIPFSVLPAWRPQIFSDYGSYYALRASVLLIFAAFLYFHARGFNVDLSVGNMSPVRAGYGDPLLSLRAFACMVVLMGHGASINFAPHDIVRQASGSRIFWLLMPMPWAGVWIFFTLSGYLMGKGFFTARYRFGRDGMLRFYRNRLLRLLPMAYLAIAITVLFIHPEALALQNLPHLLALLLFDYDGASPLSLIGLLWSIATEMQFYLLAPFMAFAVYAAAKRVSIFCVGVGFLTFGLAYRFICTVVQDGQSWYTSLYTPLLGNIDLFGVGMVASYVVQKYQVRWPRVTHGLALTTALYVLCCICWSRVIVADPIWTTVLQFWSAPAFSLATAAIILIYENAVRSGDKPPSLARAAIVWTQLLGTLTYAIYIWHAPIFEAYSKTMSKPVTSNQSIIALAIASALVIGFSWFTYKFIESPFDDMKRGPVPAAP